MGHRLRRSLRLLVLLGAIAGAVRAVRRRTIRPPSDVEDAVWPPLADVDVAVAPGPEHSPVRAPGGSQTPPEWVEPQDGACPATHPVKAKVQSGIFHAPGSAFYERTRPDRCYRTVAAAEADGLRPPRR
jgi:hypothetical protein